MRIRILGWDYENIRRIGKLSIDLTKPDGSVYENTFIMMPNGTGKTTTLQLIRAVFSKKVTENWKEKDVRSFQPVFKTVSKGKFSIKVMFDEDIYYYTLHLDYDLGEVRYETTRIGRSGGIEAGYILPHSLNGVLTEEFVKRFIFDGEQAQKTLNVGSEEAERAIVYLYQLDKLDQLCGQVDKLIEIKQEEGKNRITEQSVANYERKAERLKKKYESLCAEYAEACDGLNSKRQKRDVYAKKYEEIISQDEQIKKKQDELCQMEKEVDRRKTESVGRILSYIRRPYNLQMELHMRMQGFLRNMQTLRLPRNVAKEFFNELADSKECICGREIGEKERRHILEKSDDYLGQNEFAVLNEIKTALKEYTTDDEDLSKEKINLESLLSEKQEIRNSLDRLDAMIAEKGNQEILQVKETMNRLDGEIEILKRTCGNLDSKDYHNNKELSPNNNILAAYDKWQEAKAVYEKANGTFSFIKKAERLKTYIQNVKSSALEKLKTYIITETNHKIYTIIENDTIKIKNITGHLMFEDRENLSEGQNLAVAYAYIGTLFEHSPNQFPFVVDSPAAALDLNMREEIAMVMPGLFEQMVIFVTSGEKQGFAETYYNRSDVKYYVVEGKRDKAAVLREGIEAFKKSR